MLSDPVVSAALIGAIVSVLLLVQTWAQERRRKIETEAAREKQAEANATRVVEKLATSVRPSPVPQSAAEPVIRIVADEVNVTPAETPDAKKRD